MEQRMLMTHLHAVRILVQELYENIKFVEIAREERVVSFYYDGILHRARLDYANEQVIVEHIADAGDWTHKHDMTFSEINADYDYPVL